MASLIKKKKANTIYYYVVESARVEGSPASFIRPTSAPPNASLA
jgi:hypothetical protein